MTNIGPSRRTILKSAGGAVVVLSIGGTLYAAETTTRALPGGDAYQPWKSWDDASLKETPFALVSAAVLAANPHDTQPWLFRVADNSIEVYADVSRNLGAMDPFLREMHLGLGCAIENMTLAAAPNGYSVHVELAPGAVTDIRERVRPVLAARLRLARQAKAADPLHRAIPERHTNRYAYQRGRPLDPAWLAAARRMGEADGVRVMVFPEGAARDRLAAAVVDATKAIVADARMIADSDRWFRGSSAEIDAHRDGPTLEAAGLSFLPLTFARRVSGLCQDEPRRLDFANPRRAGRHGAGARPDRGAGPLRPPRLDRRRPLLAAAASRCDAERRRPAAGQPADREDRPRTSDGRKRRLCAPHRRPDRLGLAGDLLFPRRLLRPPGPRQPAPPPRRRYRRLTSIRLAPAL